MHGFPTHMGEARRWSISPLPAEIDDLFLNCQSQSLLHCFYALIFFFVKALRQWRQIQEAMKRYNVSYGKKLKRRSDEAFNAGKDIEEMKRLTLHCIASSLLLPSFGHRVRFSIRVTRYVHFNAGIPGCTSALVLRYISTLESQGVYWGHRVHLGIEVTGYTFLNFNSTFEHWGHPVHSALESQRILYICNTVVTGYTSTFGWHGTFSIGVTGTLHYEFTGYTSTLGWQDTLQLWGDRAHFALGE